MKISTLTHGLPINSRVSRVVNGRSVEAGKQSDDGYIPGNWAPPIPKPKVSLFSRVNPDTAAVNLQKLGQRLLKGDASHLDSIDNVSKQIKASAKSSQLPDTSKEWMDMVADWDENAMSAMLPLGKVYDFLKTHGQYRSVSHSTVTLHHKNYSGEVARVNVLNSKDELKGPGVVEIDYFGPLYTGLRLKNSPYPAATELTSLYFVSDLSKVQGLTGNTEGSMDDVQERMATLLNSLHHNSVLELTHQTTGYGDKGRSYQSILKVGGVDIPLQHQTLALAAAGEVTVKNILGIDHSVPSRPEYQPFNHHIKERLENAALLGGMAAFMAGGGAAFGEFLFRTPLPLAALFTGMTIGIGALSGPDDRATYDSSVPGARERFYAKQSHDRKMGALFGAAVGATFMAGTTYGLPGVAVAAGAAALGGALLIDPEGSWKSECH